MTLEGPGDRMRARRGAVARDLGDQVVGKPELLREPAEPIDDAVRGPRCSQRADAGDDLLVDHPVGEEFRMVRRDEGRLARAANAGEPRLIRSGQVEVADIGKAAERRHLAEQRQVAQTGMPFSMNSRLKAVIARSNGLLGLGGTNVSMKVKPAPRPPAALLVAGLGLTSNSLRLTSLPVIEKSP